MHLNRDGRSSIEGAKVKINLLLNGAIPLFYMQDISKTKEENQKRKRKKITTKKILISTK